MAGPSNSNEQLPKESFTDLKIRIDKLTKSPEERAGEIYKLIEDKEVAIWDIVCFCMVFITNSCAMMEFLKPAAKQLHTLVYLAHYKAPEELGILPKEKLENQNEAVQVDNKQG